MPPWCWRPIGPHAGNAGIGVRVMIMLPFLSMLVDAAMPPGLADPQGEPDRPPLPVRLDLDFAGNGDFIEDAWDAAERTDPGTLPAASGSRRKGFAETRTRGCEVLKETP